MSDSWKQLPVGQYELQELLGEDERGTFFRASGKAGRAVVFLSREARPELWQRAGQLDHPHLQRVLDTGTAQGATYAVFEFPDERLSAAMQNGLSRNEARKVVAALQGALSYLHERGFAHGAVTADHIIAVGDAIKLESDTLHDASSGEQAEDRRGLEQLASELGVPADRWPKRAWTIVAAAVVTVAAVVGLTRHSAPPPVIQPVKYVAPAPVVATPAPVPHATGTWRVITYTYSRYQDAAHKAAAINQKYPDFHAEVFTPNGRNRGPFLVALGGRVTRGEAEKLERRAKAKGLPRDTFARNY